ncbi:MAG: EamA family transporter [Clostridia bacterium]|nr:EamA family transporter [Clostridia bacterium]
MGYLYIGAILLMRMMQQYCNKPICAMFPRSGRAQSRYLIFSMGLSAVLGLLMLLVTGAFSGFDWVTVVLALVAGLSTAGNKLWGAMAIKEGSIVVNSIFSTASLILPCLAGVLFFDEPMSVWQWLGTLVFLAAAYLMTVSGGKGNTAKPFTWKVLLYLVLSFFTNGLVMVSQKTLTYVNPDANITLFTMLMFAIPVLLFSLMIAFGKREAEPEKLAPGIYLPAVFISVAFFVVNYCVTAATKHIPTALLFVVSNGGSILAALLVSLIFFKDRYNWRLVVGLILGVISLLMINFL